MEAYPRPDSEVPLLDRLADAIDGATRLDAAAAPTTTRASFDLDGSQRSDASNSASISVDGTLVASVVVRGDRMEGFRNEIYLYDRTTGNTEWISAGPGGTPGDGTSDEPAISGDGRYVAFRSSSDNLVPCDDSRFDVFVRDRKTGAIQRIRDPRGGPPDCGEPSFSPDGHFLAFTSDAPREAIGGQDRQDVLLHDMTTGKTQVISRTGRAYYSSREPSVSSAGRFVAFVYADDRVVVRDRTLKRTEKIAGPAGSKSAPALSASGRFVAFTSYTRHTSQPANPTAGDVFLRDRKTGTTQLVSVARGGGRGNGVSGGSAISPGGRYVAFASFASDLVPRDTNGTPDVFVRDRRTQATRRVSTSSSRGQANGASNVGYYLSLFAIDRAAVSGHGPFVAFESGASNLVAKDTNDVEDVFVRGPLAP